MWIDCGAIKSSLRRRMGNKTKISQMQAKCIDRILHIWYTLYIDLNACHCVEQSWEENKNLPVKDIMPYLVVI